MNHLVQPRALCRTLLGWPLGEGDGLAVRGIPCTDLGEGKEAASGFEPLHRGFADLSLNHLGTPPPLITSSTRFPASSFRSERESQEPCRHETYRDSVRECKVG